MPRRCTIFSLMLATAAVSFTVWGAPEKSKPGEWPQWRGPQRDGISTEKGLLPKWESAGPPLLWKSSGLGDGYSSVTIHAGRIFTMGRFGEEQSLVALPLDGGNVLWKTKVGAAGGKIPNCTPTTDGNLIYAVGTEGDLLCAEAASGKEVWRKNFGQDFGGRMMSGWGYSESPLIDGDKLICTPGAKDAAIVALNKKTGDLIWKAKLPDIGPQGGDGAAYSSIVVAEVGGIRQYVQLMGRGVVGVDAKDGRFLWSYNRVANGTANIPTPIVKGDLVFCSTGYNTGSALLKLVPEGKGIKAEEVYFLEPKVFQNHHGGIVLIGDYVYGGHQHNQGFPICVELKTGKVVWNQGRGPGSGSAAVVYADGNLYFRYENGTMALIEATPKGYQQNGSFDPPKAGGGPSWAHPVVAGGKLYLREQGDLLCYDVTKK